MKVRIPIAQDREHAAITEAGEYAFVIIDTEQISHIHREADSRSPPGVRMPGPAPDDVLYTETTIYLLSGAEVVFKDADLCAGWTHDALLEALNDPRADGVDYWNQTETKLKKARKK